MMMAREDSMEYAHQPVMLPEVIEGLQICSNGIYVDATFGRGGHARALLAELNEEGRLLVFDRDPAAVEVAEALARTDTRVKVRNTPFSNLYKICEEENWVGKVNGILLDLGVSSPQLDDPTRGFSFKLEGPLDMRMDPSQGLSAAAWLKEAKEAEIAWVLKVYGEERFARRIARAIVRARDKSPILSTHDLAQVIANANPAWERYKHPATRSFQAIRIFINRELDELTLGLNQALEVLAPKGRLAVISFHSLEDRIVKQFISKHEKGDDYPAELPILAAELRPLLRRVGRRILPSSKEVNENIRARSAVLRLAEKIGD